MQNTFNLGFTNNSLNFDQIEENFNLFNKNNNKKPSLGFSNMKLLESLADFANHNEQIS